MRSVFFAGLVCILALLATRVRGDITTYADRAEFEASVVCFTRYPEAAAIWNALMLTLPSHHLANAKLVGRDVVELNALLRSGVRPCQAVARVLRKAWRDNAPGAAFERSCTLPVERVRPDSPVLHCLQGARFVANVVSLQLPAEMEARARLQQASAGSGEETLSYDGTYATNLTKLVVEAAVNGARKKKRGVY